MVADELTAITAWLNPPSDWWTGRMEIEAAYHFYMTFDYRRILTSREFGQESPEAAKAKQAVREAEHVWRVQCLKQVFIPAQCVRHLRWKQDWLRRHGGGTPETALAIARDEAALVDRIHLAKRQQAGRKANRKAVLL
ncbi:hypothetical protein LGH82_22810 [Mesorhizobium sp. PAMC28654]|uniref:hypothetical protein n=1 Tax=Mesorhizobium sp. PAMC28654 TaxID=2880934 RepID=UPI001D0B7FC6|nr:hypothetical protein [Mesorhizobium sp. PAMC28654]UDL87973.1 hypothetical protein LGH82_22810 [Mesorhizobium sp. PAMC28654]